ncbi:peptidase domain-containing ABC transporter [Wenzhouxiangella sp. AB-CW3]|uniref:peptidase domain-containing ABC transporter n=1 Tax=Wenzhouxiangella sp. AB-CW3 TaxID=2771012 RepID=UPI00168B6C1A|nr:peptidase domain-containing ABC transporter [Wenzhouxiangella sp. AB-CW3]QOC22777.1 peptidase domain-containing ABC transporter [Wenzhouxiangella sp. AB-CW3]
MKSIFDLARRFTSLERVSLGRRKRIPFVAQHQHSDCGPACLAMVLGMHGRHTTLDEVVDACGTMRRGTNAHVLLNVARRYGLLGRGVRVSQVDDLRYVPRGSILHWKFHHYVVFDRIGKDAIWIMDPARGQVRVPLADVDRALTGVALTFEAKASLAPGEKGESKLKPFFKLLLNDPAVLHRVIVVSFALQLFALGLPLLTGVLVDRIIPRQDHDLLMVVVIGVGLAFAFRFACSLLRSYSLLYLRTRLDSVLTFNFLDHLISLPFEFFDRRKAGDLVIKMNSSRSVRDALTNSSLSAVLDGSMLIFALLVLVLGSIPLAMIVLAFASIQVLVFLVTRRYYRQLHLDQLIAQSRAQGLQIQILTGIEPLKSSGREHVAAERWSDAYVDELNVVLKRGRLEAWTSAIRDGIVNFGPLLFLAVGAYMVLAGSLSLGLLLALSLVATNVLQPLNQLLDTGYELQKMYSHLDRINDVFGARREDDGRAWAVPPQIEGHIEVDNVTFSYESGQAPVLKGVSFEARPGEFIGVVGQSGSGKSTLARLLAGLYLAWEGCIRIDGADLKQVDLEALRQQLGVVTQDVFLLQGSVRENISYGQRAASLEEVRQAARMACIHEEIEALPLGYYTQIGDGASGLSGGQKQRIALARALFQKPKLLILDEATSALDSLTEAHVHQQVEQVEATRVVIAHRLSTIRSADQILVFDEGEIVERGTHDELIARQGHYYRLYEAQQNRSLATGIEHVGT